MNTKPLYSFSRRSGCFVSLPNGLRYQQRGAFSLTELMVAVGIFSIMCVVLLQIVNGSGDVIRINQRRFSADNQARFILDRIGLDLEAMFPRRDLPRYFANVQTGKDFLKLIADVPASSGDRRAALIAWRISPDPGTGKLSLRRAAKGLDFSQTGWVGLRISDNLPITFADIVHPAFNLVDPDFDTLGEGVVRVGLAFQERGTGELLKDAPSLSNGSPDLSRTAAISVTLVVIDTEASNKLTNAQLQSLASAFPEPVDEVPLAQSWGAIAANSEGFPGIPADVSKRLRVYQRFYPLCNFSN